MQFVIPPSNSSAIKQFRSFIVMQFRKLSLTIPDDTTIVFYDHQGYSKNKVEHKLTTHLRPLGLNWLSTGSIGINMNGNIPQLIHEIHMSWTVNPYK